MNTHTQTGEGNGNPLQYSCLGNPMDKGDLWATVHENEEKSDTTERLNNSNKVSSKFLSPVSPVIYTKVFKHLPCSCS